jgi:hypothetical protein
MVRSNRPLFGVKGSGGGKKSRSPQYPLRHSGHGEIDSKVSSTWHLAILATFKTSQMGPTHARIHQVINTLKRLRASLQDFTCFPFTFPCRPRKRGTAADLCHVSQRNSAYSLACDGLGPGKVRNTTQTYSNLAGIDHLSEGTVLAWNLFTANISATSDCHLATRSSSTTSRSTLPDTITVHHSTRSSANKPQTR